MPSGLALEVLFAVLQVYEWDLFSFVRFAFLVPLAAVLALSDGLPAVAGGVRPEGRRHKIGPRGLMPRTPLADCSNHVAKSGRIYADGTVRTGLSC